jgi:hypothetical protein
MGDGPDSFPSGDDGDDAQMRIEPLTIEPRRTTRLSILGRFRLPAGKPRSVFRSAPGARLVSAPMLARASGLLLLAALVLATAATALRGAPALTFPLGGSSARATSTSTTHTPSGEGTPQPTPLPTVVWGRGWTPAGPVEAQRIIFAQSAPAVAYTCGAPTLNSLAQPAPIVVQVSLDRGHTWRPSLTPATGVECDLTVDPTDARDVVLAALPPPTSQPFSSDAAVDAVALYRSFDGGATWQPWPLPTAPDGARYFTVLRWAWSASALFVAPLALGDASYHRLAASIGRQASSWVNQRALFAAAGPDNAGIVGLVGTAQALYVLIYSEPCAIVCRQAMRSADGGTSWSRFAPSYQGDAVILLAGAGESVLFGQILDFAAATPASGASAGARFVRGRDSASAWEALPTPPGELVLAEGWELPDGRVYAALDPFAGDSLASPGLYALAPDASFWTFVAPYPAGGPQSLAISWDDEGHALSLWGAANSFLPDRLAGLETFPL